MFVTDDLRTKGAKPPAEEREKRPEPTDPRTEPAVDRYSKTVQKLVVLLDLEVVLFYFFTFYVKLYIIVMFTTHCFSIN